MFGFDERFALFDITPVENQFILELLPKAKGDYVKVFLYGLMRCYHPESDMNLDRMSHELNMTQEEIQSAFRYWERHGAVRRVSDNPPVWQYKSLINGLLNPKEDGFDEEYKRFSEELYEAFDKKRRLHGSELRTCFEWKEDLHLPEEVILMLLNHMISTKGKNFSFSDADKAAAQMAQEDIRTIEKAEDYLSRDKKAYDGARKILKLLGKNYAPSEAQVAMYRKWTREWQFTHEAVEKAAELTAKGDPNMGYLDGILKSMREEADSGKEIKAEQVRTSTERGEGLRAVLNTLGRGEINQRSLKMYDGMKTLYPQEVILLAARECCLSGKGIDEVQKLLQAWKEKGLESEKDISDYVSAFHEQNEMIRKLRKIWGLEENRISKTDRSLLAKWKNELGFGDDMILSTAVYASEAKTPMTYLDKILSVYAEKGIRSPEQAEKEHAGAKRAGNSEAAGKTVSAQRYTQRNYEGEQQRVMDAHEREMEEFLSKNGGKPDA